MRILLKKARIIAPGQPLHGGVRDLLIEDGVITQISHNISEPADQLIAKDNLHISPGWMDIFANFGDPGYEFKEDLESGAQAAASGGFTDVMVIPNTSPPLESKAQIEYIISQSHPLPVNIHPIGAISRELAGKSLAEMYEMHRSGALAFSDGLHPVQSSGLLLKALQYVKAFGGTLIQIPDDTGISHHGLMHEGLWSTRLGMPGKPAIAEEILIRRDLELLRYTGSRLHFTGVSLEKSIDLIREAKAAGLAVSCSITPYHLSLTDDTLQEYDSNYKVNPPLREQKDITALRKAVKEGIIDCFATHHLPQEADSKQKEFEYAEDGMIGLESAFGILGNALPGVSIDHKINLLAINPRRLFDLPVPEIAEKAAANLTLFDPDLEWTFGESDIRSKSRNSPFLGKQLKGKVFGILHKNQFAG
jgi:dihydroorotase